MNHCAMEWMSLILLLSTAAGTHRAASIYQFVELGDIRLGQWTELYWYQ